MRGRQILSDFVGENGLNTGERTMFSAVVSLAFAAVCIASAVSLLRGQGRRLIEARIPRPVMIIGLVYVGAQSAYLGILALIPLFT